MSRNGAYQELSSNEVLHSNFCVQSQMNRNWAHEETGLVKSMTGSTPAEQQQQLLTRMYFRMADQMLKYYAQVAVHRGFE